MIVTFEKLHILQKTIEAINLQETLTLDRKFNYAVIKNYKRIDSALKAQRKEVLKVNLKYCVCDTDAQGNQIPRKDKDGYVIAKENVIPRLEELEALELQTTEFEPYTYTLPDEVVEYVGDVLLEEFEGIFFKAENV